VYYQSAQFKSGRTNQLALYIHHQLLKKRNWNLPNENFFVLHNC